MVSSTRWAALCLKAACVASTVLSIGLAPAALAQACSDVALVLAVDGSGSIDAGEFRFQQQAIADSLRDPDVLEAMARAGTVSVAAVFWGDPNRPVQETEAVVITGRDGADRLAGIIENMPRRVLGNTGLSAGLEAALDKLATMGCAHRPIINVSGDGKGTILSRRSRKSPRLEEVRARAAAEGVTINALTISNEETDLAQYYQQKVITGPGAFVMDIRNFADYAQAFRRKLVREIAPQIVAMAK